MITISTTITTTTAATNTITKTTTTTATIIFVSYPGTKAHPRNVHNAENWHAINANVTITTVITIKPNNVTVSKQISNDMLLQIMQDLLTQLVDEDSLSVWSTLMVSS